ncbi:MAG: tetratricopeptide repeat protein [Chloroflexota bacterium]|nr:tetratricopeptide repeat protein [Chloroflexota bacterium]
MRIRIWGARGSIPSSIKPEEVEEKICRAILGLPDIDPHDEEAVRAYVGELPPLLRGTAGGNTPCVEIQAGGELFVVDAGSGFHDLGIELLQGPFGRGEGTLHLLISHLHWDHIQGFPMFMPAFVPGNRIFVYGIHDVKAALEDQQRPPKWSVSLSVMKADIEFIPLQVGQPFSIGNVRINTIQNTHPGRSYSYRFQDRHSVLVYASDAEYKQLDVAGVQPHIQFFRNADVLIFDAQYTLREAWQRVDWGHSSAMIGIDLARSAGVKKLLLFHHDPTYSDAELQKIQSTAIAYQSQDTTRPTCEVIVAYEGLVLDLIPPGAVALQLTPDGEAAILTPTSVFDELGVDQLAQQLSHLAEQDAHASSIIDLSQVETLTTASLKSLVALRQERKDTPIVLAAPSDSARQVIKLGRYLDYFAIYPSVEDALAAVHTRETLGLPGQVIKDRYQIQNKVGESQLGIVLTAMDTHLNRTVALKIFSPSFSEETIARFARQAGQIMSLDHRSIVQVLDWDSDEGYSFKVEEFVAGPTLQGLLFDSYAVFSASQAVDTAMDIARALEYAHSWGVLHGDLKPQNVFLTDGQVKVSGFGLGLLEEGRNLLDTPLIFLTASHLAPEQILGQPLDARTDLYALGVILYQLFTGHKPFEGTDREVMHAHLHLPPRPPRELNPHLSLVLEHLILKLLAKNPSDRYASAREVWCILASLIASTGETVWQCGITLVGREEPLRALQACWEDACAGRGQLALISGESGIGKTSLAQQFALQSKPSVLLVGRGWELEGSPPYHLVTEALQPYFAAISSECFDEKDLQLLGSFAGLVPGIRRILPDLPEPTRLEPDQEQLRLMASLTQFIKRVTREQPWFIVLDDLQWADQNSLKLLCYLGRHLPSMSLLIVGTYHDAELEWGHPLRGALRDLSRQPTYHDFPLGRLDQAEVGRVLTDIWLQPAPADLTEKIYQHTRGNPFYVGEVARGLVDDGLITLREGKRYFPGLDEVRLPQDVREAIWRRIRHLSPDTQTLLRYAAVLGQTFRLDDLQEISGLSEWEVLEHLDMALERRLVQESPGEALLRFCHPEIQDVLYADLGPPRRRLLHCRAGEALERRAGLDPEHMAEELAYHFSEAGEVERALAYSVQAAHRAEAAHANGAALLWYNQTLEMLNQLGPEKAPQFQSLRLSAHESLGDVLARIGQYDEALEHYASALFKWLGKGPSYFDEAVPSIETARIYIFGAELYYRQGRYDEAISWCQKSLDIASQIETLEGQQAKARACYLLGDICIQSGDLSYAVQFCRESLQIYQQIDDLSGQAGAYSNLGLAYYRQGDWLQARESFQESLTIRKQVGDVGGQGQINNHLALIHINRGEWPQAMNLLEQSRAIWEQIGVAKGEANTMGILARVFMHQENWVEARVCLSQNQVISIEVGYDEHLPELERHWGEFYLETGELDAALDHARRSVELAVEHSNLLEEGMACRVLGQVHLARGELEPAEAALHQSLDILSDLNSKYEATKTKLALVRLVLETGLTPDIQGEAQSYLVQAIQTFEKLGAQTDLAEAQSLEL